MKKIWIIPFLLIFSISVSGCAVKKNNKSANKKKKITIPALEDPISFDPRKVPFVLDFQFARHLFSGLYNISAGDKVVPNLASRIEVSKDKKTYTIYLKKSYWSDNTPVTSYDFKESWQELLSPEFACPLAYTLYPIKNAKKIKEESAPSSQLGVETPKANLLIVHLEHPLPYFEEIMAFPITFPVHHTQRKEKLSLKKLISNGPFILKKWEPQHIVVLEKNPFYWDVTSINFNEIEIKIIKDSATAALMFEKKQIHWFGPPWYEAMQPHILNHFRKTKELHQSPLLGTTWIGVNLTHRCMKPLNIRLALSMAIDRESLIKQIFKNDQKPANCILPPSLSYGDLEENILTNKYEAIQIFNKALLENKLNRKDFSSIKISYMASNATYRTIAMLLQQQWKNRLGIEVKIEACEAKLFLDKRSNLNYDLLISSWIADFNDPISFLEHFQSQGNATTCISTHYTGFNNAVFDSLLKQAAANNDNTSRKNFLLKAENILMKELPVIPLYHPILEYVVAPRLHNVELAITGGCNFIYANLEEEK